MFLNYAGRRLVSKLIITEMDSVVIDWPWKTKFLINFFFT